MTGGGELSKEKDFTRTILRCFSRFHHETWIEGNRGFFIVPLIVLISKVSVCRWVSPKTVPFPLSFCSPYSLLTKQPDATARPDLLYMIEGGP